MRADSPSALPFASTPSIGFVVEAGSDPGVLIRILEAFARRETMIDSLAYCRNGDHARLEAVAKNITDADKRQVAGQIRQVIGVTRLEVSNHAKAAKVERVRLCA